MGEAFEEGGGVANHPELCLLHNKQTETFLDVF